MSVITYLYNFSGINSEHLYVAYRHLVEGGFMTQTQKLSMKLVYKQNIKWSALSNHLGRAGTLQTDSVLDYVFMVELVVFCVAFIYIAVRSFEKFVVLYANAF